jgi:hypothetical protein
MTAEDVMLLFALGLENRLNKQDIIRWVLADQGEDGSCTLARDVNRLGNISMTVEAYFTLKLCRAHVNYI